MNLRSAAELGMKLLGIYALLQFIGSLPHLLVMRQSIRNLSEMGSMLETETATAVKGDLAILATISLLYLVSALVLIFASRPLASRFIRDDTAFPTGTAFPGQPLTRVALQFMGVYALIHWFPDLIQTLVRSLIYGTWESPLLSVYQRFYQNGSHLIAPVLGSMLGFALLFRARGFVRVFQLARPMSRPETSD